RFSRDWSSDVCSSDLARIANFNFRNTGGAIVALWGGGLGTTGSVVDVSGGVVDVTTPANFTAASSTVATTNVDIAGLSEDRIWRSEERRVGQEGGDRR